MLFLLAACTEPPPQGRIQEPMAGVRVGFDYTATLGDEPDFTRFPRILRANTKEPGYTYRLEQDLRSGLPSRFQRVIEEGACRLTYDLSTCVGGCPDDQACWQDTCVERPAAVDLGPVVFGYNGSSVVVDEPFYSDDWVATGSGWGPLSVLVDGTYLEAGPIYPPDWESRAPREIWYRRVQDGVIRWSDRLDGARVRLVLAFEDDLGRPIDLLCDGPDNGELILPASMKQRIFGLRLRDDEHLERYVIATSYADPDLAFEVKSRSDDPFW